MKKFLGVFLFALSLSLSGIIAASADKVINCDPKVSPPEIWEVHLYAHNDKTAKNGNCTYGNPCLPVVGRKTSKTLAQKLLDVCLTISSPGKAPQYVGYPARSGAPIASTAVAIGSLVLVLIAIGTVFWFSHRQRRQAG